MTRLLHKVGFHRYRSHFDVEYADELHPAFIAVRWCGYCTKKQIGDWWRWYDVPND